jgi:1-acyl-sn-glycerol-3-phosphate acyltransferase
MATPAQNFYNNIHFWILPLLLVIFNVLFDVLPKPIFFGLFAVAIGAFFAFDKYKVKQTEKNAQDLESIADTFLNELNASEKSKQEQEQQKKVRQLNLC